MISPDAEHYDFDVVPYAEQFTASASDYEHVNPLVCRQQCAAGTPPVCPRIAVDVVMWTRAILLTHSSVHLPQQGLPGRLSLRAPEPLQRIRQDA